MHAAAAAHGYTSFEDALAEEGAARQATSFGSCSLAAGATLAEATRMQEAMEAGATELADSIAATASPPMRSPTKRGLGSEFESGGGGGGVGGGDGGGLRRPAAAAADVAAQVAAVARGSDASPAAEATAAAAREAVWATAAAAAEAEAAEMVARASAEESAAAAAAATTEGALPRHAPTLTGLDGWERGYLESDHTTRGDRGLLAGGRGSRSNLSLSPASPGGPFGSLVGSATPGSAEAALRRAAARA